MPISCYFLSGALDKPLHIFSSDSQAYSFHISLFDFDSYCIYFGLEFDFSKRCISNFYAIVYYSTVELLVNLELVFRAKFELYSDLFKIVIQISRE